MGVLVTVSKEIIEKIKSGEKKVEFRKKWTKKIVNTIYFCQKSSHGLIPIKASLEKVEFLDKNIAWRYYKELSGVDSVEYFEYLKEKQSVFCLTLSSVEELIGRDIEDFGFLTAPQNYYILR